MANKAHKIFISSTVEDLVPYRDAAESAIVTAEHAPLRNEYWAASSDNPPYAACMKKVEEADALVVIVAHRYGWVPRDQPGKKGYSITRLECLRALKANKPVFAFVVVDNHPWPPKQIEREPEASQKLDDFKTWLKTKVVRNTFTTDEDLEKKLLHAITIHEWGKETQPKRYLNSLKNEHAVAKGGISTAHELEVRYKNTARSRLPVEGATVDKLDWELVKQYAENKRQTGTESLGRRDILLALDLFASLPPENNTLLHRPAMLCFCRNPENLLPQAKAIYRRRDLGKDQFRLAHVYGPLSRQIAGLLDRVTKDLDVVSTIGVDGKRVDTAEVPSELVRELLSNAVIHRDYSHSGSVTVTLTPEWLEIRSPGRFKEGLSWGQLLAEEHAVSDPVDPAIALYMKKLGYLLDSGDPYILWSTEAAFSVPPMMDLYGTGSMATACCTSR